MRRYEMVAIKDLKPYESNARTHSPEQIDKICRSIQEFGFINPVLVDSELGIIAGHGRVEGAKKLGMSEVPCLFVEDLTEAQKKAYIIADNKLTEDGGWDDEILKSEIMALTNMDFDISLTGFELDDFNFDEQEIEFQEDEYDVEENIPEEPKTKPGDIYQLGRHKLICGDSTNAKQVDALTGGVEIDLCLTDPPYNVNYEGSDGMTIENDNMDDSSFHRFLYDFYTQMLRVLKPEGAYYIFHADSEGLNFRSALVEAGGIVKQNLIWVKNALVLGRQDYQWKHEPCLYGWGAGHYFTKDRTQTTVFEDQTDIDKLSKEELKEVVKSLLEDKTPTTIIHEHKPLRNDVHPTMKPIKLVSRLILNSTKPGESVIDFFGGSGSTMIACEQTGRTCYMMELDPKYCDVIVDRWEHLTGEKAVKLNK